MQALKKSIYDAEMCLEQRRRDAHHQAHELKTIFSQKIRSPTVLLGGLSAGVLLSLLCGKRRESTASAAGKKPRHRDWRRTVKTLARYTPIVAAATKSINTLLQKQKKTQAAP